MEAVFVQTWIQVHSKNIHPKHDSRVPYLRKSYISWRLAKCPQHLPFMQGQSYGSQELRWNDANCQFLIVGSWPVHWEKAWAGDQGAIGARTCDLSKTKRCGGAQAIHPMVYGDVQRLLWRGQVCVSTDFATPKSAARFKKPSGKITFLKSFSDFPLVSTWNLQASGVFLSCYS